MTRGLIDWTDENVAWAASQWASGISQTEIGRMLGYANGSGVQVKITGFLRKYGGLIEDGATYDNDRKALVKGALAVFVSKRRERMKWSEPP